MPRLIALSIAFASLLSVTLSSPTESHAAAQIAAHRAVYDLTLKDSKERSGVENVEGRMVIELSGSSCEGWTVTFRMINRYLLKQGITRLADNRSSSWESSDGDQLRFSQRQYIDSRLEEEHLLKVDRKPNASGYRGEISKPAKGEFELDGSAVFPVRHQVRLIDAAVEGRTFDRSIVYDGSEGAKAYLAVAFLGKPLQEFTQEGNGAAPLNDIRAWPVTISYFSTDNIAQEGVPVYQVSFRMFENGVAGDLVLDYGDFVLKGKLSDYEALEQSTCD